MMVLFFHAARLAMVKFDPYLSSQPLAEVFLQSPDGVMITEGHFYPFSSVFYYTNREALLWRGRRLNLEYGSYAPGAANVFVDDGELKDLSGLSRTVAICSPSSQLCQYLTTSSVRTGIHVVGTSGGKLLLTNNALP